MSNPAADPRSRPHAGHDAVACPACESEIRGGIPDGPPDDPAARCPADGAAIESVPTPR